MDFKRLNLLSGWFIFAIAAFVYIGTVEPTASFWDCGEFIACAYKLEVGHQPGAPFFMLLERFFSLLAGGDVTKVAKMQNIMSALASAFTIMFLFWTITHMARKFMKDENLVSHFAILGSGIIGALTYTFSDTFWFSAVESEVYATSSLFTAVVFWCILKWENVADEKHADRWILLIALLMGISIGVHLLNLLTIPAIVMVYYFRKYKPTVKGSIKVFLISLVILGLVLYGFITWVVKLAAYSDLLFVNSFGLPFNSGAFFFIAALIALIIYLLVYTHKNNKVLLNKIVLVFAVMLIGYSSYVVIILRASANTPINISAPKDAFSLLNYLNREQYEVRPLIYGANFNAPVSGVEPRSTYVPYGNEYIKTDLNPEYKYDKSFKRLFPRMASNDPDHAQAYKTWAQIEGEPVDFTNSEGKTETYIKPTFSENMGFFFRYQLGHMYFRYFMWNFSGRQNDIQGFGGINNGNWLSGISFIDNSRLGPQDKYPSTLKNNKARNVYYMLPLIIGLAGLFYHYKKHKKDFSVVSLFFVFTGIAIAVYLNEVPVTPRERDYAVGGSFYVFSIWIGLGLLAVLDLFKQKNWGILAGVFTICLVLVPGIMAKENWDDHDRSNRYVARDIAYNYLNSCAPNAILFTNADNDTYPLWYAQEVEGIRRDVRLILLPFLNANWYIEKLTKKVNDADATPMSIKMDKYFNNELEYVPFYNRINEPEDLKSLLEFVGSDNAQAKLRTQDNNYLNYFPTNKFRIPVDTALVFKNGTVSQKYARNIVPFIEFNIGREYILKGDLVVLDIIANNNWKRPVYFLSTQGPKAVGLDGYLQQDGFAYRLVPVKSQSTDFFEAGIIDTDIAYDLLMNKFKWGNMNNPGVYIDYNIVRTTQVLAIRNNFARLANQLVMEGKQDSAIAVLDKCMELLPHNIVPYDVFMLRIIDSYRYAGAKQKAEMLKQEFSGILNEEKEFYNSLPADYAESVDYEKRYNEYLMMQINK